MNPFQTIADHLVAACPPGFAKTWITAEVDDDHTSMQYWYELAGIVGQPDIGPAAAFEIGDALISLKQRPPYDAAPWTKCRFTITSGGEIDVRIDYPES